MKFWPNKYRESQRDWFGKRGISWHLIAALLKSGDGQMEMFTLAYTFKSCNQVSCAIVAIVDDVLVELKNVINQV